MKKLMCVCALALVCVAKADFTWSWWEGAPDLSAESKKGLVLGFASDVDTVTGAQLSLVLNRARKVRSGVQGAIGYSAADTVRNGVQCGFITRAKKAALQVGLVCINDNGFLPWFVFFNFDTTQFGGEKSPAAN